MKVSELMAGKTPKPDFVGKVVNDNMVLAINTTPTTADVHPDDYAVLQVAVIGFDPQLNPTTQDETYIRAGTATTKTGQQRSFALSGTRYVGDTAQDFVFSHGIAFGVGEEVVTDYVFFNLITGKGEKGKVSIIVNSDASGNAGENSSVSVDFKQALTAPTEYTYSAQTP